MIGTPQAGKTTMFTRWIMPAAVFVTSLAAYLWTLPSTVSFEDSAEFVAAAATLGIPHASGYPLFVLLGRIFAAFPLGTVPWRVALLSAVSASGAVTLGFLMTRRLVRRRFPVTPGIEAVVALVFLTLAVSETWWSQAIMAEVYALHALLMAGVGYALVAWMDAADGVPSGGPMRGDRWVFAASFLFGLALSDHLFLALPVAPVLLAIIVFRLPRERRSRVLSWCVVAGMAGLLPYVLLPVRSGTDAFLMADASTWHGFLNHVLRLRYGDVGTPAWNKGALVLGYAQTLIGDLGPLLLVLAIIGAVGLFSAKDRQGRLVAGWLLMLVMVVPAIVAVRGISWKHVVEYLYKVYGIAGLLGATTLASFGAALVYHRWGASGRRLSGILLILALAGIPSSTAAAAYSRVVDYAGPDVELAMRSYMAALPQDAVLVMNDYGLTGDTEMFVIAYLQQVEGIRPDVTVVTDTAIRTFHPADLPGGYARFPLDIRRRLLLRSVLEDEGLTGRPIVTSWPATGMQEGGRSFATGYAYVFGDPSEGGYPPPVAFDTDVTHPTLRAFMSHLLYAQAAFVLEHEGVKASMPWLVKAIELDPDPQSSDYLDLVRHRAVLLETGDIPTGKTVVE